MKKILIILSILSIIIVNSYAVEDPLARVSISDLSIKDLSNNTLEFIEIGSQILISVDLINNQDVEQPSTIIFKISDNNSIIQLGFVNAILKDNNASNFSISWLMEEYSKYKVEVFVWESLDNPIPLADKSIIVIEYGEIIDRSRDNYIDYMLELINKDRSDHGLKPVELSNNIASQKHAEDMLKYRYLAHWDSQGYKPYMRYLQYGGEGEVRENAAFIGYMDNYEDCVNGIVICEKIDPMTALRELEYVMVYDDAKSDWGHRDNILDRWHNKVSIGVAYDDYFLALVQHFENDYIEWEERKIEEGFVILKGIEELPDELEFGIDTLFINGYYDPFPKPLSYEELRNLPSCYTYGGGNICETEIVEVIMPELPLGYKYTDDVNIFTLDIINEENGIKFEIRFKPTVDREGLYTFVLYARTIERTIDQYIPLTSYTIAYRDGKIINDFWN